MICKWCGAKIIPGQEKCEACGRPVPPLSDYGTLFSIPAMQNEAGAQRPAAGEGKATEERTPQNRPVQKKKSMAGPVIICLLAVMLAASLAAMVLMGKNFDRINEQNTAVSDSLDTLQQNQDQLREDIQRLRAALYDTQDVEASDTNQPVLAQQNSVFEIVAGDTYRLQCNLGDAFGPLDAEVEKTDTMIHAKYWLHSSKALSATLNSETARDGLEINCSYDIYDVSDQGDGFGTYASSGFMWEYSLDPASDNWNEIQSGDAVSNYMFTVADDNEATNESQLRLSLSGSATGTQETLYIRCTIERTNQQGGSVRIIVGNLPVQLTGQARVSRNTATETPVATTAAAETEERAEPTAASD